MVMAATYVNQSVTSSLWSDQTSTPASTLSSQNSLPLVLLCSVCTEQPSDLSWGNTNISSGDISISSNVLVEFAHESYAELSDLVVGFALGVEICSTFATSDVH